MRLIDADAIPWTDLNDDLPYTKIKVLITFADKVNRMPTIEERKKGKWIDTGSGQECSECHEIQYGYDSFRYFCAFCGADMRGEDRETDLRRRT